MTTIQQNLLNPNNQPLVIGELIIRQDEDGRYSLADLHKASGNLAKHKPSNFLRVEQIQELIKEIEQVSDMSLIENNHFSNMRSAVKVINGGNNRGTYAVKEIVYAYAMWISAKFHLIVIRAYDALVMQWKINDRQSISPEQQALLHEIVSRRSGGERKIFAEMWARHNRHFKIPRYAELLAIHFPEAVHYLETMEIKAKSEKQEVEALPYPQQVIQVAQQINNEYNGGHYHSWFVQVRDDGQLSAMPLLKGYYPINLAEFAKKFDGLLDFVYGNELLTTGRYLASK
ncbi:hypothetical protein C3F34_14140 [Acinetobacter sp. ACNIH2]|uniref:KilA-N domain-containing protein n=1 Tax=Acinetobacter sp. ACNIH2 TaxID=1758189 RepID=UPI000CDC65B6|nr:KilA-N domain-containing protein [Acinetobacter sp. ACNIH2]AUX87063.1 hypothetical protein C3F34_14140 [Acinetobacter sp. ACNIH2]